MEYKENPILTEKRATKSKKSGSNLFVILIVVLPILALGISVFWKLQQLQLNYENNILFLQSQIDSHNATITHLDNQLLTQKQEFNALSYDMQERIIEYKQNVDKILAEYQDTISHIMNNDELNKIREEFLLITENASNKIKDLEVYFNEFEKQDDAFLDLKAQLDVVQVELAAMQQQETFTNKTNIENKINHLLSFTQSLEKKVVDLQEKLNTQLKK